jgi:hypothetical protein
MQTNKPEIIECCGTPYEIGRQYGQAAKKMFSNPWILCLLPWRKGFFRPLGTAC